MTERQALNAEAEAKEITKGTNYEYINLGWKGTMYFITFKGENGNVDELRKLIKASTFFGFRLEQVFKLDVGFLIENGFNEQTQFDMKLLVPNCESMNPEEIKSYLEAIRDKAYVADFYAPAGV